MRTFTIRDEATITAAGNFIRANWRPMLDKGAPLVLEFTSSKARRSSEQSRHGKGMGIKAHHYYVVPACAHCHRCLDEGHDSRAVNVANWDAAFALHIGNLIRDGHITTTG